MIHQRVRALCDLYGNTTARYALTMTNLSKIPKGSIGLVESSFWDMECRDTIYTVRFDGGVYVNVRSSTLLPIYGNEDTSA